MAQLRFLWILFIITILFVMVAASQAPKTKTVQIIRSPIVRTFDPSFKGKPEEEIELLEHKLSDATRNKNAVVLAELLSDSVLIAELIGNKNQYIALLKSIDTKYYSLEKSEMRIQMYGDVAIVTGIQKAGIDIENGSRMSQTIFLNTWKKFGGHWQCIGIAN